ncbi:MAG: putative quinol monooxygenase [Methanoregula sp.]|jgi:quinol monooxygenase YgiN|uniref:putative quinol monooxygenase n=1 Tax=Methanoregula sp. TaxID=2052170 RepID=UPI003C178D5A
MATAIPRSNLVVTVQLKVKPRSVNKMRVIAHDLIMASRGEDGCVLYLITESADDETKFFIYMVWFDEESYQKHAGSPYVRAFMNEIAREILEKRVVTDKWHSLG